MRIDEDFYDDVDDQYDYAETRSKLNACKKPVNNRMATLNRQAGIINRYRNQGILK